MILRCLEDALCDAANGAGNLGASLLIIHEKARIRVPTVSFMLCFVFLVYLKFVT